MKSLNWAGRTGHDKVPGGNRRPVPENSGAQSAFFTCWLGLTAQRQRLFEALGCDTSRQRASVQVLGAPTPPASAIIARNRRVDLQDFPRTLSSNKHTSQPAMPAQKSDSRPATSQWHGTAPRHQATAVALEGGGVGCLVVTDKVQHHINVGRRKLDKT